MALFGAAGDVKKPSHVETGSALMPLLYAAPSPRPSTSFRLSGGGLPSENQVRAMIGGGAKKPVERAFGAVGDSRRIRRAVSQRWT
jgi:hypothetical protein